MRKLMIGFAVLAALVVSQAAWAGSTNTVTNALGQVFTVVADNYGVHVTLSSNPNQPASSEAKYASLPGIQIDNSGATTTTNTAYYPRALGDILVGYTGGTGTVWMALGSATDSVVTNSSWKALYQP